MQGIARVHGSGVDPPQVTQTPTKPELLPHTNAHSLLNIARQPSASATLSASSSPLTTLQQRLPNPPQISLSPSPITNTWPSALIKLVSRQDTLHVVLPKHGQGSTCHFRTRIRLALSAVRNELDIQIDRYGEVDEATRRVEDGMCGWMEDVGIAVLISR